MSTARTRSNEIPQGQGLLALVQSAIIVNFLVIGAITYRFADFTSVKGALYVGVAIVIVSLVAALVPWTRVNRRWQILVAIADLVAIAAFASSLDEFQPALSALAVIPLIWIALQFGVVAAVAGAVGAIAVTFVPFFIANPRTADYAAWGGVGLAATTVVFIGVMVHLIGNTQRRQAMRLRATQYDLRTSVARAHSGSEQLRGVTAAAELAESSLLLAVAFGEESAEKLRASIAESSDSSEALYASVAREVDAASVTLAMMDSADTGLTFFSPSGEVVLTNASAAVLNSLPASVGMSLDGRVGHTTVIDEILRGAADGRTVDQVSYWVGEGSNQRSMVASSKIVRRPSGEILGTVIATQDVTPLSDSLRARDEFLKMLSHDMRSPLTSIIGYLEVIEDSVDVHRAGIAVELAIIRRNAARLLALAEDIRHSTNASDLSTQAHDRLPERETRAPISPSDLHELRVGDLN